MFCQNCGNELPENAKFCANCGESVPASAAESSSQPAQDYAYTAPQPATPTSQTSTDLLLNEYQQKTEQTTTGQQPSFIPSEPQPVRYTAEPVSVEKPKRRSKLIPGLCIAAGAVVVLGGAGAVIYNLNKASINHMIMGDTKYAYTIAMQAASGIDIPTEVVDAAVSSAVKTGMTADAAANMAEIAEDSMYGEISAEESVDSSMNSMASMLEFSSEYINSLTGMSGAEVTFSGSLELSDNVKEMMFGSVGEEEKALLDDLLGGLNETSFSVAEKDSGNAYEYSLKLDSGNDSIIEAQIRYEQDGTLTIVFPGITETGLTTMLTPHSDEQNKPKLPDYDVSKLLAKISSGISEKFKEYDIKCVNGEKLVGGLKFSGMTVEIKLSGENIAELIEVVADAVECDEELKEYLDELGSSDSLDDMVESLRSGAESVKESADFDALLSFYVNPDNTLAGGSLLMTAGEDNSAEYAALSSGNTAEMTFSLNGVELVAVRKNGTSDTAGKVEIDFTGFMNEIILRGEAVTAGKYALFVDYTDAGVKKIFGIPTNTGSYVLTMSSDLAEILSSDNAELKQTLEKSSITFSQLPEGKGVVCKFGIDVSGYGKCEFVTALDEPKGEVAPKPGSSYKLIDVDNVSGEEEEAFGEDFMEHFQKLAENNKLVKSLYEMYNKQNSQADVIDYDYYQF